MTCKWLLLTDTRQHNESSESDAMASPFVRSAAAAAASNTPSTVTPKLRKDDRQHFFGSNFNLEALAEAASLQRSTFGADYQTFSSLIPWF